MKQDNLYCFFTRLEKNLVDLAEGEGWGYIYRDTLESFHHQIKILKIILDATYTHFINDMYVSRFHRMSNQQTRSDFF